MADKEKTGQSPGDETVSVTIRLPVELVEEVDATAEEELRTRTGQITKYIKEGLAKKPQPAGKK